MGVVRSEPTTKSWWNAIWIVEGLVAMLLVPVWSEQKWPPTVPNPSRIAAEAGCFGIVVLSLFLARKGAVREPWASVNLLVPIFTAWLMFQGDMQDSASYPWLLLVPTFATAIVGGWLVRLRISSILISVFVAIWFAGPFTPPTGARSGGTTVGGLTAEWARNADGSVELKLTAPPGTNIRKTWVTERIETEASCGILVPLTAFPTQGRYFMRPERPDVEPLNCKIYPPDWVGSYNLRFQILRWPSKPLLRVEVPLVRQPNEPNEWQMGSDGAGIKVMRIATDSGQALRITSWGFVKPSTWARYFRPWLRVSDDTGTVYLRREYASNSQGDNLDVAPYETGSATKLIFEAFSEGQWTDPEIVLDLNGIPNRR